MKLLSYFVVGWVLLVGEGGETGEGEGSVTGTLSVLLERNWVSKQYYWRLATGGRGGSGPPGRLVG